MSSGNSIVVHAESAPTRSCDEGPSTSNQFRASDLLVERFRIWELTCAALLNYFECISGIQRYSAREFSKIGTVLQRSLTIPLCSGLSWNERGRQGLEGLLWGVREDVHKVAQEHDTLAKLINSSIVIHIQKLQAQIKSHIASINESHVKLANLVGAERDKSSKSMKTLLKTIQLSQSSPSSLEWRHDPWYCNELLVQQLQRQIHQENLLQKSVSMFQTQSVQFEEKLMRSIQSIWKLYQESYDGMHSKVQPKSEVIDNWLQSLTPIAEWDAFSKTEELLLNPKTPLRDPSKINYPEVGHPNTKAVHQGVLLRKKKYKKFFKEGYYVVTPSGYMFQFESPSFTLNPTPELCISLPKCTLGTPTSDNSRFHQFSVLIDKKNTFNLEPVYTFRAKSHRELMEWWNVLKYFCKVCPMSPLSMTRNGRISIAARDMGYGDRKKTSENDNPQPQYGSVDSTPATSHNSFEASDRLANEPPQSTSAVRLIPGDQQKITGASNQKQPRRPSVTTSATAEKKVTNTSDLVNRKLHRSALRLSSSRGDSLKSCDVQQHKHDYESANTTSVTPQGEVGTNSDIFTHGHSQSTSSMHLEMNTALDRAYKKERFNPSNPRINGRTNPTRRLLIDQSDHVVLTSLLLLPIKTREATPPSQRFRVGTKARYSI